MRKILLIHVAVILVVLVVISPLAFLETKGKTVETINGVTQNNGEFLSLNLLIGQTVSGSCVVNYDAKLINFFIIDPQGKATEIKPTYRDNTGWAFFSFTAITDGQYDILVNLYHEVWTYIDYTYSVTPPTVFGFSPIVLIGVVIALGIVVELVLIVRGISEKKKKPSKGGVAYSWKTV